MKQQFFNKNSIFFTINITFLVSLLILTLSSTILYEIFQKKEQHYNKRKSIEISKMLLREHRLNSFNIPSEFKEYLGQLDYILIDNEEEKKSILQNKEAEVLFKAKLRTNNLILYKMGQKQYLAIFTPKEIFILEDKNKSIISSTIILFIYFALIILLGILYFTIINKLKPIQTLHQDIKKLSNEDFNIQTPQDKKDEISLLANEFYQTAMKLKTLKESRNIFIRNIMHELKTPITKGKLLSELEQTAQNNQKMKDVFLRLEALIVEFASIEELIAAKKELNKKEYFLEDIIDESTDLLMIDDIKILKAYDSALKLNIDFKLFTIAVKNLLDNGYKYSLDKTVSIKFENNTLIFENSGEALKYPIERYFEPFFKGDKIKSNESFGLGLYIVYHILNAHKMKLEYSYENSINRFSILS